LGAFLLLIGLGVYSWSQLFTSENGAMKWGLPVAIGALSAWIAFRTIHYPRFAEFLIATESEMAKVKWPSRQELRAATAVILMNVVILTLFLFVTDIVWRMALWSVGVLQVPQLFGNAAGM
jgi:preprotein translocase subunit SecE